MLCKYLSHCTCITWGIMARVKTLYLHLLSNGHNLFPLNICTLKLADSMDAEPMHMADSVSLTCASVQCPIQTHQYELLLLLMPGHCSLWFSLRVLLLFIL